MATTYGKRISLRRIGPIIDKINIILSVAIVVSAVVIVLDVEKYLFMFPVIFTLGALMNGLMAFKCYKMAERIRMIFLFIAFAMLVVLSIVGYIVTLK